MTTKAELAAMIKEMEAQCFDRMLAFQAAERDVAKDATIANLIYMNVAREAYDHAMRVRRTLNEMLAKA